MPTTVHGLPYPLASAPLSAGASDIQALATALDAVASLVTLSVTPPTSPIEGQLWPLQAGTGVVWMFRYNAGSASAYKWEFVGGPPLSARIDTQENTVTPAAQSYNDMATVGPQVTVPRAGEYVLDFGAGVTTTSGTSGYMNVAPKIGAGAAGGQGFANAYIDPVGQNARVQRRMVVTAAAADLIKLQYSTGATGGAATCTVYSRDLHVTPVRVS